MTDTNDTEKPWAAPGLPPMLRIVEIAKVAGIAPQAAIYLEDAIKAACADALADAAPKVEWVPIDRNGLSMEPVYITDGTNVAESALGYLPSWATHSAKIPPRTLPAPP